jgi:hypothetical protein
MGQAGAEATGAQVTGALQPPESEPPELELHVSRGAKAIGGQRSVNRRSRNIIWNWNRGRVKTAFS